MNDKKSEILYLLQTGVLNVKEAAELLERLDSIKEKQEEIENWSKASFQAQMEHIANEAISIFNTEEAYETIHITNSLYIKEQIYKDVKSAVVSALNSALVKYRDSLIMPNKEYIQNKAISAWHVKNYIRAEVIINDKAEIDVRISVVPLTSVYKEQKITASMLIESDAKNKK